MKYFKHKDEIGASSPYIIDLGVEGYTGLISPEGKPSIALKIDKEVAKVLSMPSDIVQIKFNSMDEAKDFIANLEKALWQTEHGEA